MPSSWNDRASSLQTPDCVRVCRHSDCGGGRDDCREMKTMKDFRDLRAFGGWNDAISAVSCCSVTEMVSSMPCGNSPGVTPKPSKKSTSLPTDTATDKPLDDGDENESGEDEGGDTQNQGNDEGGPMNEGNDIDHGDQINEEHEEGQVNGEQGQEDLNTGDD